MIIIGLLTYQVTGSIIPAIVTVGIIVSILSTFKEKIIVLLKAQPYLKVVENEIKDTVKRHLILFLKLKNRGRVTATGVECPWSIYDADTGEFIGDSTDRECYAGDIPPNRIKPVSLAIPIIDLNRKHVFNIELWCNENSRRIEITLP